MVTLYAFKTVVGLLNIYLYADKSKCSGINLKPLNITSVSLENEAETNSKNGYKTIEQIIINIPMRKI